jgi:predicted nucleic acid-binding Zn ribbon protein
MTFCCDAFRHGRFCSCCGKAFSPRRRYCSHCRELMEIGCGYRRNSARYCSDACRAAAFRKRVKA